MLDDWNSQLTEAGEAAGLGELVGASGAAAAPAADLFGLDHRAEFLARGRGHAVAFTVCNDALFVATSRNFVLRHDLGGDTAAVAELEASKSPEARVRRLFVDPLGRHALLTLQTGGGGAAALETFYVDGGLRKARALPKLKGLAVTSVAWSPALRAAGFRVAVVSRGTLLVCGGAVLGHTREALLGTEGGAIYELALEEAARGGGKERLHQLQELRGEAGPIAGLAQVALSPERRLVLALCGTRLHAFSGGPTLEAVFGAAAAPEGAAAADARGGGHSRSPSQQGWQPAGHAVVDLPTQGGAAQLQLLCPAAQPEAAAAAEGGPPFDMARPEAFAVLAPAGIYYGTLDLDPALADPGDHLTRHHLLPAAVLQQAGGGGGGGGDERPLSLTRPRCAVLVPQALTQYHLVLLYPSKLQYVNRTSKQVVQEVPLQRFAAPVRGAATMPLGLCRDQLAGRIYVLAGDDALEVDGSGEDRDMWRVCLDKGEYRAALHYARCRGDWEGLLEYLLQRGEAERALEVLRRPSVSPELHYKFAPALVAAAPQLTVQAWVDAQPPLEPRRASACVQLGCVRLLPALLHFGEGGGGGGAAAGRDEALKYVRYCLYRLDSQDPAVHNLAVALLSQEEAQEQELLDYLAAARGPSGRPLYDPVSALRLARDRRRLRACVALYCEVGLCVCVVS
ncbi:hypothetical protein CHLNCDRAFT_139164 [Chlorella variabilis]|uniref:Pep3/Vps18 beta-propeller domain-containing protein n=1 Tax=Chlorella variabilis TaxID=554065 RepID=E1ZPK9_CHLVA|nr:hypothetical protein CHLNCDRAFT_139164 [Chlorella variabilis]EFN52342.1 hypothetical protein CHLNCDRAFT_139164 [Chlorella variabilis]|eukprot:XP_005844444.1 hypothetical protein CHLNCDRAFT_139164 [Chlorella variabilis]